MAPEQLDVHSHLARHIILRYNDELAKGGTDPYKVKQRPSPPIPPKYPFTVAIIGAGMSGLYTAMILRDLNIPFKIFEATEKVGGRIFTHKFSDEPNDYFDVGPMRFPKIRIMDRLFRLFEKLDIHQEKDGTGILQDYVFEADTNRLLFNRINKTRKQVNSESASKDPFRAKEVGVAPEFLDVTALKKDAIDTFMQSLQADLKSTPPLDAGLKKLMRFDDLSVRAYLSVCKRLPTPAINWMETRDTSTGSFDTALSEWVLESMAFGDAEVDPVKWKCLKGGSQVLADRMEAYIENSTGAAKWEMKHDTLVTKLKALHDSAGKNPEAVTGMEVTYSVLDASGKPGRQQSEIFDHVISTLPLSVFRSLDHDSAGLDVKQESALRQLKYGPAIKVGMKFKKQWWSEGWLNIQGGQSATDRSVRVVVYPSNGINPNKEDACKVLIASYAWTEDAERLSALINSNKNPEEADERLKTLVLRDLAAIHPQITYEELLDEYVAHFAWSWDQYPYSQGAYAQFGPGDFQFLYPELTKPAAGGRLHFAGEALSIRHAWIVGALDSAWRAVREIILLWPEIFQMPDWTGKVAQTSQESQSALDKLHADWGTCREWVADRDERSGQFLTGEPDQVDDFQNLHLHMYAKDHRGEFATTPFGNM